MACAACGQLEAMRSDLSHFELFGLPCAFEMEVPTLERRFRKLARLLHPDFFGDSPEAVRRLALTLSSDANRAYQDLSDPFRRAEYMLHLLGRPSGERPKSPPVEFLERILEARETIEEARHRADPGGPDSPLPELARQTAAQLAALERELAELFSQGLEAARPRMAAARLKLDAARYFSVLLAQLQELGVHS